MSSYKICTRCVMDTSDIDILFDNEGQCNHCNEYFAKKANHNYKGSISESKLDDLVKEIKHAGKGKKYDCVIGLSGGIDSSYAAYILKEKGLRVLAVHLDNGWNSEEAVQNIKNIARKLGIDYESYVLNWDEFREIQLAFLKASVPEAETPTDMAIPASWHILAAKYGVKYIISGGNFATEGVLPVTWHYNGKDTKYFNHIVKTFGNVKKVNYPVFGYLQETYYKLVKGIKIIYLLNFVNYNKEEAMEFLKEKLEWKYYGGKHYESKYTGFIQSYYLYKKFGIDYRRATLSAQICAGVVSRDEAMKELEKLPFNQLEVQREIEFISKKLKISVSEFEQIIAAPGKYYRDYPNDEQFLKLIYDSYRKIFKKEKLANF